AIEISHISMAVIIQEMVKPVVSGVAFTKNPITGFDEILIEAIEGTGDQLVQGVVTPARWVYKWGKWMTAPSLDEAILTEDQINQLRTEIETIAEKYKQPADIEWVFDGESFQFVQIRQITTLQSLDIYSNRISKEVLPGIILPLIWSINIPLVNTAWINMFTELIGQNELKPEDLSRSFHYRAYFNMGAMGVIFDAMGMQPETLEVMIGLEGGDQRPSFRPSMKVMKHMPRMLKFGWQKWRYAAEIENKLPIIRKEYERLAKQEPPKTTSDLFKAIDHLFNVSIDMAYMNIIGPLLSQLYTSRFNKQLEKTGIDPTVFDFRGDSAEFDQFDPNVSLEALQHIYQQLPLEAQTQLKNGTLANASEPFAGKFEQFVNQFGHMSDSSNDFSQVPWRENRPMLQKMVAQFEKAHPAGNSVTWQDLVNQGQTNRSLKKKYEKAKQFQIYREQISSTYIFGYGQFRNYFRKLGDLMVKDHLLENKDDIFYLFYDEIQQSVKDQGPMQGLVATRKQEIESVQDAIMPETIYGDVPPPVQTSLELEGSALNGVPTSPGYYEGSVRVITKASEFEKVVSGDVLVIPFSDVSWTPLFAKAGAIVAESGGMLSHSSIVAREYGLPAVVSVPAACAHFKDGDHVLVDGYQGTVTRNHL
ncbi:MAG: PEP-utilizing enzyme, partial [Chloroflexota bacterium]